jgi:glycosyltransferase involved in cell wall biosynthesis
VAPSPDATVVIPTHERAESLRTTLESLTAAHESGRNPGFAVIVVDDASTDATADVVASAAAETSLPIRYERLEENRGSYAARNLGASHARGSLILFVDDDIIVGPDHIARHAKAHSEEGPRTLVLGDRWEFTQDAAARFVGGHFGTFRAEVEEWIRSGLRELGKTPYGRNQTTTVDTCDMSISRDALEAIGPFDEEFRWIGDQEFALRSLENGFEIVWDPEIKSFHNDPRWSFRQYCKRIEDGSRAAPLLARKHPSTHDKGQMIRENGPVNSDDPLALRMKKLVKAFLARPRVLAALHAAADHSSRLPYGVARRLYWGIVGVHVFIGIREGLAPERGSFANAEKTTAREARRPQ